MAGQGFALLTPLLWKGDVAARRLSVPFPDRVSTRGWAYWLVYPSERRMVPPSSLADTITTGIAGYCARR